ncbi:MAG TPA: circadian clock protein KaiC [Acidimicrobiales bacterium]|nr:circadian clock protein KaiC [Acidimicrobiales bacterium]
MGADDEGRRHSLGVAAGLGTVGGGPVVVPVNDALPRVATGIPGFDQITLGGLTAARTTLVTGAAGTGKTILAAQFLCEGVRRGEPGVFVTFEEPASDLRRNLAALGWDIAPWEEEDSWRFVDGSPVTLDDAPERGQYNFDALLAQIGHAVDRTAAQRIALDSINVALAGGRDPGVLRGHMRRLALELRRLQLTAVMTVESDRASGVTNMGFEQFVADNVVVLRNVLDDEKRRRTVEVMKMRGAMHRKGEYPFTVLAGQGVVVIPLSVIELSQQSTDTRISSGNAVLDELCRGGFYRDSVVLASGATGTGKTLMVTEFMAGGAEAGERCLLFAFEESRDQIFRNARGWGQDFERFEDEGLLRVVSTYPEVASLEDHLVEITREIESFRPHRIAIDSLSALERSGTERGFREFLIVLTSYIKAEQVAALFTATTPTLLGGDSVTDGRVSTLTDSIILLRYVEVDGEVKRGVTVLKMRGSDHDRLIREFTIDGDGMHIGEPFRGVAGILSGQVVLTGAPPYGEGPGD